jgi:hypothetical protein
MTLTFSVRALAAILTLTALPAVALAETVAPAATSAEAPIFYNVYAGMNLTDAQAARLVEASDKIGAKLIAVGQNATILTGPEYGLSMIIRNPGPEMDTVTPRMLAEWDAYAAAGLSVEEQQQRLTARFGDVAIFDFQSVSIHSDAVRAAAMTLQQEWRAMAFDGLTAEQIAIFDANEQIVNALVGADEPLAIQWYVGSGGQPLVAPAG